MVVIGEPDALTRLRRGMPPECDGLAEMRPLADFLAPYDTISIDGETRRREMERFYAGLRGRIIVRLMAVNLNPEAVTALGESPLKRIRNDWAMIEQRLLDLLSERADEGMTFVTVLVAEEGDWTAEHRDDLLELGGQKNRKKTRTHRQRCYLMTRLLELGSNNVVHSKDAWPAYVGGLLRFLVWGGDPANDSTRLGAMLDSDGLYAWRTLRVIAGLERQSLMSEMQLVFRKVNELLFGKDRTAVFTRVLKQPEETSADTIFPPPVTNALGDGKWSELPPGLITEKIVAPGSWEAATGAFGKKQRTHGWGSERTTEDVDCAELRNRLKLSESEGPAALFPGALPLVEWEANTAADGLNAIRAAMATADERLRRLQEWWKDHQDAAKAFVTGWERLVVGVVVAMAFCYFLLVFCFTAQRVLPWSPLTRMQGIWLATCAVAGVAVMLLLGYLTQRWRGSLARGKLVECGGEYISAEANVRQTIAQTIRMGSVMGGLLRHSTQRRILHQRLSRIEHVLQNELQMLAGDTQSGHSQLRTEDAAEDDFRRLLEVEIGNGRGARIDEMAMAKRAVEDFLLKWRGFLERDTARLAFLPVPELLRLCLDHTARLRIVVECELREARTKSILENIATTTGGAADAIEEGLKRSEIVGQGTNFFSVDLNGAVALDQVWYREGFASGFTHRSIEHRTSVNASQLGSGVIAIWHSECPLKIEPSEKKGALRFVSNYSATNRGNVDNTPEVPT